MTNTFTYMDFFPVGSLFETKDHILLFKTKEKLIKFWFDKERSEQNTRYGENKPDKYIWTKNGIPNLIVSKTLFDDNKFVQIWEILFDGQIWWINVTEADLFSFIKMI